MKSLKKIGSSGLGVVSALVLAMTMGEKVKALEACIELKKIESQVQNLEKVRSALGKEVHSSLSLPAKIISRVFLSGKSELQKSITETDDHYVYELGPEVLSILPSWISSQYVSEKFRQMSEKSSQALCELKQIESSFAEYDLSAEVKEDVPADVKQFYLQQSGVRLTSSQFEMLRLKYKMVAAQMNFLISYSRAIYANQGFKQQMCLKAEKFSSLPIEQKITDQPEVFNLRKSGSLTSIQGLSENLKALCENLKQDSLCDKEEGGIPFVSLCSSKDSFAQSTRVDL